MKNIKNIIIGIFVVIGFVLIVTGFTTNNEMQNFEIEVENKSANDYKVCVYCYGQEEGSATVGWSSSATFKVPCTGSNLKIKYGTISCRNTAYSSGYNSYTLN